MVNEKLEVSGLGWIMDNRCFHFWCLFKSDLSKTENCSLFRLGKWPVSKWLVDSAWCLTKFAHKTKNVPSFGFLAQSFQKAKLNLQLSSLPDQDQEVLLVSFYVSIYLFIYLFIYLLYFVVPIFLSVTPVGNTTWNTAKKGCFLEDERISFPSRDQWFTEGQDQ